VGRSNPRYGPVYSLATASAASYFRGHGLASTASAEGETPHVALTNLIVPQVCQERKCCPIKVFTDRTSVTVLPFLLLFSIPAVPRAARKRPPADRTSGPRAISTKERSCPARTPRLVRPEKPLQAPWFQ